MKTQRAIDFNKVQWADYWYENQQGICTRTTYGIVPSVNGMWFCGVAPAPHHPLFPGETLLERAVRLKILDKWTAVCKLNISANRTLTYRGKEAAKIWAAYRAHIYGNRK